ncbi:MAG TPA: hypothetical protein PL017_05565 [Tenuifilaceae bacterium]|nr:hypothetical protein [Tenuifilaceae bacterium]HPE18681.1 hypothetical protein [Tenuifilaceae bacterium]HPJ45546.1 hypothetical protein [Tenuifilaceae bacterium]HPQ33800.1 hypothetical protein [Tenuifilaceae bacterium]HRX68612.1 hypothetical protein [Tenuifilaceae bacterium]
MMKSNDFDFKELLSSSKIMALSWKEPYASLMLHGKIETRTWPTKYRGLVLICVSKLPYSKQQVELISGVYQQNRLNEILRKSDWKPATNSGMAIAVGRLLECRAMKPVDEDDCFVSFNPNLFCHFYVDVNPIKPFPWKGKPGWKNVPQEIIRKIEFL